MSPSQWVTTPPSAAVTSGVTKLKNLLLSSYLIFSLKKMRKWYMVLAGLRYGGSTRKHKDLGQDPNTKEISSVTVTSCLALGQLLCHDLVSHFPHLQNKNNHISSFSIKVCPEDQVSWHLIALEHGQHAMSTQQAISIASDSLLSLPSSFLGHLKFITEGHLEDFILILKIKLTYWKLNGTWSSIVKYIHFLINLSSGPELYIYLELFSFWDLLVLIYIWQIKRS